MATNETTWIEDNKEYDKEDCDDTVELDLVKARVLSTGRGTREEVYRFRPPLAVCQSILNRSINCSSKLSERLKAVYKGK